MFRFVPVCHFLPPCLSERSCGIIRRELPESRSGLCSVSGCVRPTTHCAPLSFSLCDTRPFPWRQSLHVHLHGDSASGFFMPLTPSRKVWYNFYCSCGSCSRKVGSYAGQPSGRSRRMGGTRRGYAAESLTGGAILTRRADSFGCSALEFLSAYPQ